MGLDIWTRADIRNVLLAANAATASVAGRVLPGASAETAAELAAYRAGYEAALLTLALAFGVQPAGGPTRNCLPATRQTAAGRRPTSF